MLNFPWRTTPPQPKNTLNERDPQLLYSAGVDSDAGHHDVPGQRAHLGGGQEPAGRDTAVG